MLPPSTVQAAGSGGLNLPDVALLDFHLRGGERSEGLIAQLRQQGVPVILLSGSFEFPASSSLAGTTILEKPVSETQLVAHLGSLKALPLVMDASATMALITAFGSLGAVQAHSTCWTS